jgi:Holliday junction resolvasome RuvABC endonuclease subunit
MAKTKDFGPGIYNPPGEPMYIGIDQSYSGFAVTIYGGQESSFATIVTKFEGKGVDRLEAIYDYLDDLLKNIQEEHPIGEVAIEGYAFGSQMANMLGELGGIVRLALKRHGVYPLIIPPTTLKKYVTGKGTGIQKNQMLLHAYKKWGVEFTDDNACDSFALARLASGKGDLAYEIELLEKIKDPKYRQ